MTLTQVDIRAFEVSVLDAEIEKQNWKKEQHETRLANCGKFRSYRLNPQSGNYYLQTMYCGDHNGCPVCAKRRGEKLKKMITGYSDDTWDSRVAEFESDDQAKEYCKLLEGKQNYLLYPQSDGTAIVFFDDDPVDETQPGELLTNELAESMDWTQISKTPKGRRSSGSYAKPSRSKKETEEIAVIYHNRPTSNAPRRYEEKAAQLAYDQTSHLNPENAIQAELAMEERTNAYIAILAYWGFEIITLEYVTLRVKIKRIQWVKDDKPFIKFTPDEEKRYPIPPESWFHQ